jgi:hypothetical protein
MKRRLLRSRAAIEETLLSFAKLGIVRTLPLPLPTIETRNRQHGLDEPLIQGTPTLTQRLARAGDSQQIPLALAPGVKIKFSSGGRNVLAKKVIAEFCSRFTPGGKLVHVGGSGTRWAYFDEDCLRTLGVVIQQHREMPDVVVHFTEGNWIVLIQLATSQGPVNEKRRTQLNSLFGGCQLDLVFVSAFLDRRDFSKCRRNIAWGTHLWFADAPDHMIHLNGGRFLEPYSAPSA